MKTMASNGHPANEGAGDKRVDDGVDIRAILTMIDYVLPEVRIVSPVSTLFLTLAQKELISILLTRQNVIFRLPIEKPN